MIQFLIRRPVLVAMLLTGLSLLGVVSYSRLPLELLPATELPQHIVTVTGGQVSDPGYIEQHGVIPVESAIAGLGGIERIESLVNRSRGTIYVYFEKGVDLKFAYLKLQGAVAAAAAEIQDEFSVSVSKTDPEQLSNRYFVFQARGEGTMDQIRAVVDEKLVPELGSIDGVSSVEVYGGRRRSIEVLLDERALEFYGLTSGQVASRISAQSGSREYLGQVTDHQKTYFVNLISEYSSIPSFEDLVVKDLGPVMLKHVATIVEGGAEQETISRINGQEAVTVTLQRSWDSNLISLAHRTRRAIEELDTAVETDGMSLAVQADEAKIIEDNLRSILLLALVGALLAVAVLWVFLRNFSLVVTVAATVPISILISMNLFYALKITINTLTLVGLAIAIGMLVDNSIVVLENIFRHLTLHNDVRRAVVEGTREVARAIAAATLTTVAVFVPFLFSTDTMVKALGRQVGAAIISTLLVSLAVAFLLVPTLAYRLLSRRRDLRALTLFRRWRRNRPMQIYVVLLKTCLRYPARAVVAAVVLFFISLNICLTLSVNVPREPDLSEFSIYAVMPSGMTLEAADEQVKNMDELLKDIPEVSERLATIQEEGTILTFRLAENYEKESPRSVSAIKDDILERLEDSFPRIEFSDDAPQQSAQFRSGTGGGGGGSFTRLLGIGAAQERVIVHGQDLELLRAVADDIRYNIDNLDTVRRTRINVSSQRPSIDLLLDQAALSHFDVSLQTVRNELSGFQGETSAGVTFKAGTEEIDIIIKSAEAEEEEKQVDDLRRLLFPSDSGGFVPLTQVARLLYSEGYANINRINQEKRVEVTYSFEEDIEDSKVFLEEARASVEEIVAAVTPPPGVLIEVAHDESSMSEFTFLIIIGVLLIFMILASTFESFLTPAVMMFTLPLAAVGAFLGLSITGNSIYNANVLVGFLILLGIVVNNGIILIDYSRQLVRRKFRAGRALMTAGRGRVRPILITAVTTTLGMLPIALGQAEYIELIGAPFAVTVIGGLSIATLFTLVLIPTVSFWLENALTWWKGLDRRIKLLQIVALVAGEFIILSQLDDFLWQVIYFLILFFGIPAFTYFLLSSLRHSRATVIPRGESITITVRNISKLYDDFSRFIKEWRKGKAERGRREASEKGPGREKYQTLLWQTPLYLFAFYFTYFYVQDQFWIFVCASLFYAVTLWLLGFWTGRKLFGTTGKEKKIIRLLKEAMYWGLPLANLFWLRTRWYRWDPVIVTGVFVFAALIIYRTSRMLYSRKINVNRITGRGRRIKTIFYRFVQRIPIIGRQRVPFQALDRVSLSIGSGMFGLVGPNGSGKTTLMRIICGILPASRGKVDFNGLDIEHYGEELQSLIGYLPQEFGAYENMTAREFLDYQTMLKGIWDRKKRSETVHSALRSVHLEDRADDKIKTYSGGMKQRLGIAQTLLHLPRILVVDEPTAGLDPNERIRFRNLLAELARDRIVIFSTHIIEDISSSCNRLAVLLEGKVRFLGIPAELVGLTRGVVWQAHVDDKTFESVRKTHKVVHHMRDGEKIRIRILAKEKPFEEAKPVVPTLEDSYMWLLGGEA